MVLRTLKVFILVALASSFVSCASKPLHYENAAELSKMEEFDKIVQVKDLPPPEVKPDEVKTGGEVAGKTEVKTPSKDEAKDTVKGPKVDQKADQKIVDEKTKKTKKGAKEKKEEGPRQPIIEDSEGFAGRRPIVDPFHVGESITMMMTYFGVSAGDMTLSVQPFKEVNGRKSYHFRVDLKSSDLFSMFYLVDDWGETFVDYETLLPASMAIGATESKKLLALKAAFDHKKNQAFRWERAVYKGEEAKEKKSEWEILPFSQNVISAFYYIRNFKLTPGKIINVRVSDDGKNMVVKVEVLRREKIKTLKGEFSTLVLKPTVEIGGIFQPMGSVYFWLTDDERKMFVRMEAEIKIGKVIGVLKAFNLGGT